MTDCANCEHSFGKRWTWCEENGIEVRQDYYELEEAFDWIENTDEKVFNVFVEIGAFMGGSAYCLAGALNEHAKIILVDDCSRQSALDPLKKAMTQLAKEGFHISLIPFDSQSEQTKEYVEAYLENQPVDVLHIDGAHKYLPVKADFDNYSKFVRTNGLIFLHDVCAKRLGTKKLWAELRPKYKTSLISDGKESEKRSWKTGIGVIVYDETVRS